MPQVSGRWRPTDDAEEDAADPTLPYELGEYQDLFDLSAQQRAEREREAGVQYTPEAIREALASDPDHRTAFEEAFAAALDEARDEHSLAALRRCMAFWWRQACMERAEPGCHRAVRDEVAQGLADAGEEGPWYLLNEDGSLTRVVPPAQR